MSGSPSSSGRGSLRNPTDFHIKPLADAGARRVSVGGALTWVALAGLVLAAEDIRDHGDFSSLARGVNIDDWL